MNRLKIQFIFTFIKVISDIFVIATSFVIGYELKFRLFLHFSYIRNYEDMYIDMYLEVLWILVIIWIISFVIAGLYKKWTGTLAWEKEVTAIIKGVIVAVLQTLAFTYIFSSLPQSRYVIVYAGIAALVLLFISRGIINKIQKYFSRRLRSNKNSLIIGAGSLGQEIAEKMILYPGLGFNYIGTIANEKPEKLNYHLRNKFKRLGTLSSYKDIIDKHDIDALFITIDINQRYISDIISYCEKHSIILRFTPSRYQLKIGALNFNEMDGIPIMGITHPNFSKYKEIIKSFLDIIITILLIIIFSPVMLIIAIVIKLTSPGPVIFKQLRMRKLPQSYRKPETISSLPDLNPYGRNKKFHPELLFYIYKFRTMQKNAEKDTGPTLTTGSDQKKVTKVGSILRKTSLDELPQLFNVFKGEMSLIGPRPERPYFHKQYEKTIPNWNYRLLVNPGITGWAQMNGRAELSTEPIEKLTYDLFYIENWSIIFDLKIILRTIVNVIMQKNAY